MSIERLARSYTSWNGHRLAYASAGSGPALLLLHGLGATADFWQPVIAQLMPHYHVIVPDLIGFGFSDKPAIAYTLDQHRDAVEQVLIASGTTHLGAVIGHSCGGVIALSLLARNPALSTRLALAATPLVSPRFPIRQELLRHPRDRAMLTWRPLAQALHMTIHMFWPLLRQFPVAPALRGAWVGYMDHTIPSYVGTAENCLFNTNIDPFIAQLQTCSLLLLYGQADQTVPFVHGARMQAAFQHSQLAALVGGHYAVLTEGCGPLLHWLLESK